MEHKNMERKNGMGLLPFAIIAAILGLAVFKQIDFQNLNFKKPAMGVLYSLSFILSIFLLVTGKKPNKQ